MRDADVRFVQVTVEFGEEFRVNADPAVTVPNPEQTAFRCKIEPQDDPEAQLRKLAVFREILGKMLQAYASLPAADHLRISVEGRDIVPDPSWGPRPPGDLPAARSVGAGDEGIASIEGLGIRKQTSAALAKAKIDTVEALAGLTLPEVAEVPGIGTASLVELVEAFQRRGLKFRDSRG